MAENTIKIDKSQITDSRREFVFEDANGNQTHFYIADPSGEDIRKADWNYAKVFNTALADGFPTQAQMVDILTQRGILGEDYTRALEKTKLDLATALFRLEASAAHADDYERELVALETARLRDEFFKMNQKINGPMGNTCENIASDARNEYITSRVVEKKDGSKVWPKYDDYLNDDKNAFVLKCRFEVMAWLNGIESDFIEKMPEQAALRQIAQRRMEAALDQARADVAAAQEAAPAVEDLQLPEPAPVPAEPAAPKARRGRRKKDQG